MDINLEQYATWRSEAEELRGSAYLSSIDTSKLKNLDDRLMVWREIAKRITGCDSESDHPLWRMVRTLDYAGMNARYVDGVDDRSIDSFSGHNDAITDAIIADDPTNKHRTQSSSKREAITRSAIIARILHNLRWGLRTFMVVEGIDRIVIPFDLTDTSNSRSRYQEMAYGGVIDSLERGEHPPGSPICGAWTKPRQVGSTTFWEKLLALLGSCKRLRILIHFPQEDDAKEHLAKVLKDLNRLHSKWPEYFPGILRKSLTRGTIELQNGTIFAIRHGGGSGVQKVGQNWDFVILSEAGKYERNSPGAWTKINTAIIPAVHAGPWRAVIHEGTNDELAYELRRIAELAKQPHSPYKFFFYNWTIIKDYVGPRIWCGHNDHNDRYVADAEISPDGRYHDYRESDGSRVAISEAEYCAQYSLTPEQIGFRRSKIDKLGSLELFHQEYPLSYEESCVAVSSKFFGQDLLAKQYPPPRRRITFRGNAYVNDKATSIKDLLYTVDNDADGRWWIWHEPGTCHDDHHNDRHNDHDHHYIVAGDFSDGIPGGDYTCIAVFCVHCGQQLAGAMFRGGKRNEIDIACELAYITAYYGRKHTTVIGEMNNVGKAVRSRWIDHRHTRNYYRKLTRESFDEDSDAMWFATGVSTRMSALLALRTALSTSRMTVNDERWGIQAQDFIKHENGRYAHAEAVSALTGEYCHDDYIVATALAFVAMKDHPKFVATAKSKSSDSTTTHSVDGEFDDLHGGLASSLDGLTYGDMLAGIVRDLF